MRFIKYFVLTFILCCSFSANANSNSTQDPCNSAVGDWDGDYYDFKQQCGCHAWYELYRSNDTVLFQLMMDGCINGCSTPSEFSGICKDGKINSTYAGTQLPGTVYTGSKNMMELRNTDYYLRLFQR